MTIAMLSLAGIPGTVGFIGKFQLIHALVNGDYTWLGIVLVIGSMISLGYYLRVIATMWMTPPVSAPAPAPLPAGAGSLAPIAGGSPEADLLDPEPGRRWQFTEVTLVAILFAAASVFFGVFPSPLFDFVAHAGRALTGIF
jgi:NADH-quinone oxidoreductase subunit N